MTMQDCCFAGVGLSENRIVLGYAIASWIILAVKPYQSPSDIIGIFTALQEDKHNLATKSLDCTHRHPNADHTDQKGEEGLVRDGRES